MQERFKRRKAFPTKWRFLSAAKRNKSFVFQAFFEQMANVLPRSLEGPRVNLFFPHQNNASLLPKLVLTVLGFRNLDN